MEQHSSLKLAAAAASVLILGACGGGSTGTEGPATWPAPPPPPPPPASPAPFGSTTDAQFPVVGDAADIRWDDATQSYELSFSEGEWQSLTYLPSSLGGEHYAPDSTYFVRLPDLDYQYTALATIHENAWGYQIGQFAFGVPTAEGDVPVTGTATFDTQVWGIGSTPDLGGGTYYDVGGSAHLAFDFGAGDLSGYMDATLTGPYGSFAAPRYDFAETVFSVGSTTFSGSFLVPDSTADSYFTGRFTGPQAAELMGDWKAPFVDTLSGSPIWGTMTGIWIGKRGD